MRKINAAQRPRFKVSIGKSSSWYGLLRCLSRRVSGPCCTSVRGTSFVAASILRCPLVYHDPWTCSNADTGCFGTALYALPSMLAASAARLPDGRLCCTVQGRFVKRDSTQTLDAMETDCLGSCASSDVSALSDASWLML